MLRRLLFVLGALALVLPAGAAAQRCEAPAGTGAVDQYCEIIPDERGGRDPGPGDGTNPAIDEDTAVALTERGEDGAALARALGAAPVPVGTPGAKSGRERPAAAGVDVPDAPASNPFSAVSRAIGGDTTLGSTFFAALFAVVVLMLGTAWVGYRRRTAA